MEKVGSVATRSEVCAIEPHPYCLSHYLSSFFSSLKRHFVEVPVRPISTLLDTHRPLVLQRNESNLVYSRHTFVCVSYILRNRGGTAWSRHNQVWRFTLMASSSVGLVMEMKETQ